jgi:hypothetical protein
MSHVVVIGTQLKDAAAVRAACHRLRLPEPVEGKAELFSESVQGLLVQLSGWTYPVVCDTGSGELKYDNFGGRWGAQRELHQFLQMYACEKAKLEARKAGHSVTEQPLADGSIRLTVQMGGAA